MVEEGKEVVMVHTSGEEIVQRRIRFYRFQGDFVQVSSDAGTQPGDANSAPPLSGNSMEGSQLRACRSPWLCQNARVRLPYFQVDAFASRVFTGNPAGVCILESCAAG